MAIGEEDRTGHDTTELIAEAIEKNQILQLFIS